ncbi:hypothetical protein L195_g040506 [Trifolium pratense]|uniref:Uncharacterized protein n=1 Tax=Trifolium pratense TaxID=57577 RepID=A0A2K3M0X8_TRIPR|nr:hypothetical protein L195_g040506 [Trifolium pratense]
MVMRDEIRASSRKMRRRNFEGCGWRGTLRRKSEEVGGNSKCVEAVTSKEDSRLVNGGILLGQEDGAGGPQYTSNTNLSITGGVVRNETQSAEVGCLQYSLVSEGGGEGHKTGGVYSDGPQNIYLKLTKADPIGNQPKDAKGKCMLSFTQHLQKLENINTLFNT